MRFPDDARQQVEEAPEKWFEPYETARADGDWRAPEALMDRIYGRPRPAGILEDALEIDPEDVVEIRRMLLEAITVEHRATEPPAGGLANELGEGLSYGLRRVRWPGVIWLNSCRDTIGAFWPVRRGHSRKRGTGVADRVRRGARV